MEDDGDRIRRASRGLRLQQNKTRCMSRCASCNREEERRTAYIYSVLAFCNVARGDDASPARTADLSRRLSSACVRNTRRPCVYSGVVSVCARTDA